MPLTVTQLTAPIAPGDLFLNLASTVGFPPVGTVISGNGQPVQVDNELMFATLVVTANQIKIRGRGSDGTAAVAHDINAPVVTSGTTSDFPATAAGQVVVHPPALPEQSSYGSDGAIRIPLKDAKAFLTKATAGAYTLAAPSLANSGIELVLTSTTAAAHALTTVALLDTGVAGSPFNTATWPAQPGASLYLVAQNGLWNVVSINGAIVFT